MRGRGRILSIQYMRGLAALLVVYAHIIVVGITDRVTPHIYLPADPGAPAHWPGTEWAATLQAYLRPEYLIERFGIVSGDLGVLLFFLISGFVIHRSLEATDIRIFLWRRALRVYPLCIAVVCGTAAAGTLYARLQGVAGPYTLANTIGSATLCQAWIGPFYTVPLLWTLIVELVFYLIMGAARWMWSAPLGLAQILAIGAACLFLAWLGSLTIGDLMLEGQIRAWSYNAVYIIFLLIGAAISSGRRAVLPCAASVALLFAGFVLAVHLYSSHWPGFIRIRTECAGAALALFVTGLLLERWLRPWRVPALLGDISYPLYLCHVPLGWALTYELARRGFSPHLTIAVAIGTSLLLAWVLHVTLEMPVYDWARRIRPRLPPDGRLSAGG